MTFCRCESGTNLSITQEDREALSHLAYRKIMSARVRKENFYLLIYLFIYFCFVFAYLCLSGLQTVTHTE
jgi:hypothetical protein